MGDTLRKIWNGFTAALVAAAVLLAVLLAGVRLFGLEIYTVLSGSMEPAYHTGSVIYVRRTDASGLKAGDVITFRLAGGAVATHRIVEITGEGDSLRFRTKGDANDTEDGKLVSPEDLMGKVVFTLPYLGYAVEFIQTPAGRGTAIAAGAFLLLLLMLPDGLFPETPKPRHGRRQR